MKTILACRKSNSACWIANLLVEEGLIQSIIIEGGGKTKRAKLRNIFKKKSFLSLPFVFIDALAVTIYSLICEKYLSRVIRKNFGYKTFPRLIPAFKTDDINDSSCISFLKEEKPDVLLIYGTGILKKSTLAEVPADYILNVHGGVVPEYRNVHSDLWAFIRKDYSNIGASIIHLDRGIDSGNIALKEAIVYKKHYGIFDIKVKNLELQGELIKKTLQKVKEQRLPSESQKETNAGFYPTPGLKEITICVVQTLKNNLVKKEGV